jgi:uncharacterized protein (TIGR03085 family)
MGPLGRKARKSARAQGLHLAQHDSPVGTAARLLPHRMGTARPNLNEFFVHHEDVRRANGRGRRTHDPAMDEALWRNVTSAPWFLARRLRGAGLELQWAGTARTVRARRGKPTARIAGPPGELLLYLFGRQSAAHVEVSGTDAAIEAVRRTHFGM